MRSSSTNNGSWEFWRSLPLVLCALPLIVAAVDVPLAAQPALVEGFSARLRDALTLRVLSTPSTQVLAATLVVATVVLTSAVLLSFARSVQRAPALSLGPAVIAMCMLSATSLEVPLILPFETSQFVALSSLLLAGGGVALRARSSTTIVLGCFALLAPLVVLGLSCAEVRAFGRDALWLTMALLASAAGVIAIAFLPRAAGAVPGSRGDDLVEALFKQIERAEASEARARELECQLNAQASAKRVNTLTR